MIGGISAGNIQDYINNERSFQNVDPAKVSTDGNSTGVNSEFEKVLGKLITDVDDAQKTADSTLQDLARGDKDTSVQDVVMRMEEAQLSFKMMSEIRGKLLDSYKEIMQMQA
jgi:flagellar hook-basal body complex protein FliE